MLPKLENKKQTGTIVYIVLLIINSSTYVYIIYIVYNRIKHMPAECCVPTEPVQGRRYRHGTEHVSDAYSTVSTHLFLHFILKNHAKSKLDSNLVTNLWVIEANFNSQ